MADEGKITSALKAAKELSETDALKPATTEFGTSAKEAGRHLGEVVTTFARAVNAAVSPLKALMWGFDKIKEHVEEAVEKEFGKEPERIVSPSPVVAIPALEAMRYTASEPSLREMYTRLLLAAMDKDRATTAHPAFVEIIRQLTPDEARIVRLLYRDGKIEFECPREDHGEQLRVRLAQAAGCEHSGLLSGYLGNINRLGLLASSNTITRSSRQPVEWQQSSYWLSAFGQQFCVVCMGNFDSAEGDGK